VRVSRPLRRRLALLAVPVAGAIVISACGSSGGSASAGSSSSGGLTNVTIAYASPVPDHLVPLVTQEAGLFKKYGLNAKVVLLTTGSEQMSSLVSGQVQLLSIPAPEPQLAAIDGQSIQEVAQLEDSFDAMMVSTAKYPTVSSLNGKSIAISYPGDFGSFLVSVAEKRYGISMREVPIGAYPAQVSAFESGQVDSIPALQPTQLGLVSQKVKGMHMLIDFRKVTNEPAIQLVGYGPWLKAHRSTVVKMLEAINAGFAYYKDPAHEAMVLKVIEKSTGDSPAVAQASYVNVVHNMTSTIVPSVSDMQNALGYLAEQNAKAATFPASKLVDASYAEAAVQK